MLGLWTLLACVGAAEPPFAGGGERSDQPAGGAGTGSDDTDTAGDSDTAGTDTAEAVCDALDLDFAVVVEDASGTRATAFTWGGAITTRAIFTNPCAGTLRFVTPTSCLVDTWTLTDGAGDDTSFSGNCVATETTWTLLQGEGTSVVADWGVLERGTFQVSARSDAAQRTATEFFSVQ